MSQISAKQHWNTINSNQNFFRTKEDLPRLTELGFKIEKLPPHVWGIINDAYRLLQNNIQEENWDGVKDIINTPDGSYGSEMMSFNNLVSLKQLIHQQLLPLHQQWVNAPLIPSSLYGIRSYKRGASLINHVDTFQTHHVSSIIIVDKNLACGYGPDKESED